jgi:hypothetical protein
MQSLRNGLLRIVFSSIILSSITYANEIPKQPEFLPANFLRVPDIPKMTIEKALEITKRHASFFLAPFDALVLHVETSDGMRDVFIFSDIGQQRLMLWQCYPPDNNGNRVIENVTAYYGEPGNGDTGPLFVSVSGIETTARNRLFNPDRDYIFVADRGNGRILELTYAPDKNGGQFSINREIGNGTLHWPVDVALSAYGDGDPDNADLYVVDVGTFNQDGMLYRFNYKTGAIEGNWDWALTEYGDNFMPFSRPVSVACYPDSEKGISQIYITDIDNNNLIGLKAKSDETPILNYCQTLAAAGDLTFELGGIALDDYGRVYAVNQRTCKIEIFDYEMRSQFTSFGKNGTEEPGQFYYPCGIIIDTYYEQAEAIILEGYARFSGIQSYLINGAACPIKPILGFANNPMQKRAMPLTAPVADEFLLNEAYPNPFNNTCLISFSISNAAHVRIDIFNLLGQVVATPLDKEIAAGTQSVNYRADNLSSGVYFYQVTYNGLSQTRKLVLLK